MTPGLSVEKQTLPSFETERLILRQRSLADFEACLAMDRDPEVTRFIPGPWNDPEAHERFLRKRMQTSFGTGQGYWSIFPKGGPERFVGWILLIPYDGEGPDIEIGWRLVRTAWGMGYATEAARPVIGHAFDTLNLDRVLADIAPDNAGSRRVAEKIGMTRTGNRARSGRQAACYALERHAYLRMQNRISFD